MGCRISESHYDDLTLALLPWPLCTSTSRPSCHYRSDRAFSPCATWEETVTRPFLGTWSMGSMYNTLSCQSFSVTRTVRNRIPPLCKSVPVSQHTSFQKTTASALLCGCIRLWRPPSPFFSLLLRHACMWLWRPLVCATEVLYTLQLILMARRDSGWGG
jgi:hypothetical protein